MGILLELFLSCFNTQEFSLLKVANIEPVQTYTLGVPVQKAIWKDEPRIRICESTEVKMYRAQKAIKFWEMLGYEFDGVRMDGTLNCADPRHGEIIVTLPEGNIDENHMAATRIFTEKVTGHIAKAKIFIYPKYAPRDRVLEHELGHALGWSHYNQKFHLMHPNWHQGGYDRSGLRK